MSRPVAIATADRNLFDVIRRHLVNAAHEGIADESIHEEPLTDAQAARDWLDGPDRKLLVIDAELPGAAASAPDRFTRGEAVYKLQREIEGSAVATTPRLVITPQQGIYSDIETTCTRDLRSIALPMSQLQKHRLAILRPFLAMLLGVPDEHGAIPGTFRVIEVDFGTTRSQCHLGFGHGSLLVWEPPRGPQQMVHHLRRAAHIFDGENFYKSYRWPMIARQNGELLFRSHVIEAFGEGLFGHIEHAAGGLKGLAFRYLITDGSLYLAPFEASVRPMGDGENDGRFVLLHAPLARRFPVFGSLRAAREMSARLPTLTRVLFVRSQMGEHVEGATTGDNYTLLIPSLDGGVQRKPVIFAPLANVDTELAALRDLESRRPDRIALKLADLSDVRERRPGETAADYLRRTLDEQHYDVVHYAGHAWSERDGVAHLILPGAVRGEASGLPLSIFAGFAGLADTRLVYVSACRGISRGTVQTLVEHGIPNGVGFRYQVEDEGAAMFATTFYEKLIDRGFVSTAFCAACAAARERLLTDDESPIWLSPVLVAQTADWAMHD